MTNTHLVQLKGIFQGLPTFDDSKNDLTAIVCGASGISGTYMLRVLSESPERWKKIYALSRRPPVGEWPEQVEHVSVDLLQSPEQVANRLQEQGVKADYVFFFAYIQVEPKADGELWTNAQEMCDINLKLVKNFCEALEHNKTFPKRFLIQYGAKYYGIHLGPSDVPQREDQPRILLEPNFYYDQEDYLAKFCSKHNIGVSSTRPGCVLGAVPDAAMNLCYPLAIYALVQKHLGKPLDFLSDEKAWECPQSHSSAQLTGYLSEWIVLTEGANNQSFNSVDSSPFTWAGFWPKLAAWAGIKQWNGPKADDDKTVNWISFKTPYDPAPRRSGRPATIKFTFHLAEWAKRPEVQQAYKEIADQHDLSEKTLRDEDRIFSFAHYALIGVGDMLFSMTKARKLGYFGYVDTEDAMLKVFDEFADIGMLPRNPESA